MSEEYFHPELQCFVSEIGYSFNTRVGIALLGEMSCTDMCGVIRVFHGSKPPWVALVEVKTGDNKLEAEQVNAYWDVARTAGYQAVITISSEIPSAVGIHPTAGLKVRANARVPVHHFSWAQLLSEAITQMTYRGVDDIEQAAALGVPEPAEAGSPTRKQVQTEAPFDAGARD